MTLEDMMLFLTQDKVAVLFIFCMIPIISLGISKVGNGNTPPTSYLLSILIFTACIPGILSAALWIHTMLFLQKALWELNFFVYYLPLISMLITVGVIHKGSNISTLPWFGELYELILMIGISFAGILVIMDNHLFEFQSWWQIMLFFLLFFMILKFGWERFVRVTI